MEMSPYPPDRTRGKSPPCYRSPRPRGYAPTVEVAMLLLLAAAPAFAGDPITASPTWTYAGSAVEPWLCSSAAGGIDADGDGIAEVAVGIPHSSSGTGAVLL